MGRKKKYINTSNEPTIFSEEELFSQLKPSVDTFETTRRQIKGKTTLEKVNNAKKTYKSDNNISIEDYTALIFEYLRVNADCYSVLDFFEDAQNEPFPYTLGEVLAYPSGIDLLIEQRIMRDASKGTLKSVFATSLLENRYGWKDNKKVKTGKAAASDSQEIKFNFE